MKKDYYVYTVTLKDIIIYVGKGRGKRSDHAINGRSSNASLNRVYFQYELLGHPKPVMTLEKGLDESEALEREHTLIYTHKPRCNDLLKYSKPFDFVFGEDIEEGDIPLSEFRRSLF